MVIFLVTVLRLRRSTILHKYWLVAYGFFIAASAQFLASGLVIIRGWLFNILGISTNTNLGLTAEKLFEALFVTSTIILLTRLAGGSLNSIDLQRGDLKVGLFIGSCMMVNNMTIGFIVGVNSGSSLATLFSIFPWVLVFSLANSLMEELWFRGLFLRKFTSLIDFSGSILVTYITFTFTHAGAVYLDPCQIPFFLLILFPLALLFSYLMHKTDSIWGSMLFHAGADVFLFPGSRLWINLEGLRPNSRYSYCDNHMHDMIGESNIQPDGSKSTLS